MWFDKLTTNEINYLPFVLSLSKDLFSICLSRLSGWLRDVVYAAGASLRYLKALPGCDYQNGYRAADCTIAVCRGQPLPPALPFLKHATPGGCVAQVS